MPARQVCQNFFRGALAPFHKYRQNALLDATIALINGASLTLTSIGRYLPGNAQVKNKIKRVDRLLGNESLHHDIPLIFRNIISMLTSKLSLCVIAVDWSGYPSQEVSRTPRQPDLRWTFDSIAELDSSFGKTAKCKDTASLS